MLDKKQIQVIFLFEFKMGCKAVETTFNISNAFGPETAIKCTVQWWFKNFCRGDEGLEGEEGSGWPSEVDNNREHHRNWSSWNYTRNCPRTQCWAFYGHQAFEANWKGEKALWYVGASWADRKFLKMSFWSVVFSYSMQQQWNISPLDCDMWQKVDFIWQPATTSSVVRPRRSSKALPKAKLAPKKGHGHSLVVCCWSDPLQLSESWWNHYIWEVCSANW